MTGQEKPFDIVAPPVEDAVRCPLLDRDPEAWLRCCTARFLPVARRVAGNDATARDAPQERWISVLDVSGHVELSFISPWRKCVSLSRRFKWLGEERLGR